MTPKHKLKKLRNIRSTIFILNFINVLLSGIILILGLMLAVINPTWHGDLLLAFDTFFIVIIINVCFSIPIDRLKRIKEDLI